jgi:hypothetical protein
MFIGEVPFSWEFADMLAFPLDDVEFSVTDVELVDEHVPPATTFAPAACNSLGLLFGGEFPHEALGELVNVTVADAAAAGGGGGNRECSAVDMEFDEREGFWGICWGDTDVVGVAPLTLVSCPANW